MKIQFWSIGKANDENFSDAINDFTKRINKYYPVSWNIIAPPKNASSLTEPELKKKEAELVVSQLKKEDFLISLDERGKMYSSPELANMIQSRSNESTRSLVFLIGGAFGIDQQLAERSKILWSLSKLVFPHQLVRLILAEQVYRACTILNNEKYHHS